MHVRFRIRQGLRNDKTLKDKEWRNANEKNWKGKQRCPELNFAKSSAGNREQESDV